VKHLGPLALIEKDKTPVTTTINIPVKTSYLDTEDWMMRPGMPENDQMSAWERSAMASAFDTADHALREIIGLAIRDLKFLVAGDDPDLCAPSLMAKAGQYATASATLMALRTANTNRRTVAARSAEKDGETK
jgi:hypothetical protein